MVVWPFLVRSPATVTVAGSASKSKSHGRKAVSSEARKPVVAAPSNSGAKKVQPADDFGGSVATPCFAAINRGLTPPLAVLLEPLKALQAWAAISLIGNLHQPATQLQVPRQGIPVAAKHSHVVQHLLIL